MAAEDKIQTTENGAEKIIRLDNPEESDVVLELTATAGGMVKVFVGESGPDGEGYEIEVPAIKLINAICRVQEL